MFYVYVSLALLVLVGIGVSLYLRQHRRDVWQQWARSKGLTYLTPPAGPKILGQIGDHQVTVESHNHGSDAEGPVEVVRCCVTLGALNLDLDAEGIPGLIGDLAALGEDRISTGDENFDRDVLVRNSGDPQKILDYWNPERRAAFLQLVHEAPCDQILVREQTLIGEERQIISSIQQLDQLTATLLSAAKVLSGEQGC